MQRDLRMLTELGVLERFEDGRLVRYRAVPRPRLWAGLALLTRETVDPVRILAEALSDVAGIEAAFVFGSMVTGTTHDDSDVDIFIVEATTVDRAALHRQLAEAGALIGRQVNPVRYTQQALAERLGNPAHEAARFVREVLAAPKRWLAGTPDAIRPLATAAGIALPPGSSTSHR